MAQLAEVQTGRPPAEAVAAQDQHALLRPSSGKIAPALSDSATAFTTPLPEVSFDRDTVGATGVMERPKMAARAEDVVDERLLLAVSNGAETNAMGEYLSMYIGGALYGRRGSL